VFPHHDTAAEHLWDRAVELRPSQTLLVGVDEHTAAVRAPDGTWQAMGPGKVTVDGDGDGDGVSKAYSSEPIDALTI